MIDLMEFSESFPAISWDDDDFLFTIAAIAIYLRWDEVASDMFC